MGASAAQKQRKVSLLSDGKLEVPNSKDAYQVYLLDQSYYSGKLHSYMRYKNIPLQTHQVNFLDWWRMGYSQTGVMKMPYAQAPDGRWLQDSTPMISWLEERYPQYSVLPEDPYLQFFCYLLEDYADEWLWRPAMHYRWSYTADAAVNSIRFRDTLMGSHPLPGWLKSWLAKWRQRSEYVKNDGVTRHTRDHVESIYLNNLDWLESILSVQPYLLGDKPCLVDYGFMGPMFRHFSIDPTPAKIMRDRAPNVYLWVARMWVAKGESLGEQSWNYQPGQLPELWRPFVRDICAAYLPYLLENARAWCNRRSVCTFTVQGVTYRNAKAYDYRVWCREQLLKRFDALSQDAAENVKSTLGEFGGWEAFIAERDIASGLDPENSAPVCQAIQPSKWRKFMTFFLGTPWSTTSW